MAKSDNHTMPEKPIPPQIEIVTEGGGELPVAFLLLTAVVYVAWRVLA